MSKAHRGSPLKKETTQSGRGVCPICKRSGVKLLYEFAAKEVKHNVCKPCHSALARGKFKEVISAL